MNSNIIHAITNYDYNENKNIIVNDMIDSLW